jgi:hypothetical protein
MTESAGPTSDAVSVLASGQHPAGAAAIAAGHADYPTFGHMFPDPRRRARALRAFFAATFRDGIAFRSVRAVWRGPDIAATAVWLPPGTFPWTTRRNLAAAPAFVRVLVAGPRAFPTLERATGSARPRVRSAPRAA